MDVKKYEAVLRRHCSEQLGEIRAVYYSDGFSHSDPYGDGKAADCAELKSLGLAFQHLGSILEYGANLIRTLENMNVDLTEAQYEEMLNNQSAVIEQGMDMTSSIPGDEICRDHIESYLVDHGLFGR